MIAFALQTRHRSTTSKSVDSDPTLPGKTTYGRLGHFAVGSSHRHKGTPGAACPTISAFFIFRPFVAMSEEVMPPWRSKHLARRLVNDCAHLGDDVSRFRLEVDQECDECFGDRRSDVQALALIVSNH